MNAHRYTMEKPPPLFLPSIHLTAAQPRSCALTQIPLADSGSAHLRRKAISLLCVCGWSTGISLENQRQICKYKCGCVFNRKLVLQTCIVGSILDHIYLHLVEQGLIWPRSHVPAGLPLIRLLCVICSEANLENECIYHVIIMWCCWLY